MNRSPPRAALGTSRPPGASCCTGLCAVQVTWPHQQMLVSFQFPEMLDAFGGLSLLKHKNLISRGAMQRHLSQTAQR